MGIDQSIQGIKVIEFRLNNQQDLLASLLLFSFINMIMIRFGKKDAFAFETLIVQQFGGTTNTKQRGDLGLDGKTKDGLPIQVKRMIHGSLKFYYNFFQPSGFHKKLLYKNIFAQTVGYNSFSFGR